MPFYKDQANKVHFLDDANNAPLLPNGCVEITQAEADALTAPTPAQILEAANNAAKSELLAIDAASIRAMREYIASKQDAPQILKDRETAAQAARAKIK